MSIDPVVPGPLPQPVPAPIPPPDPGKERREMILFWVRVGATVLVLLLAVGVTFFPNLAYAPAPRVILFMLVALLPAILVGAEATTKFEFQLPGLLITAGGTFAAVLIVFFLLNYYAKPEQQIAVYEILDEDGQAAKLDHVEAKANKQGLSATLYRQSNTIILIFPEQLPEVTVVVKKAFDGPEYRGTVGYAGSRTAPLKLGTDLQKLKK